MSAAGWFILGGFLLVSGAVTFILSHVILTGRLRELDKMGREIRE